MIDLNDCCSCASAAAVKANDATASATNVFTISSSMVPRVPGAAGERDHSRGGAAPSRGCGEALGYCFDAFSAANREPLRRKSLWLSPPRAKEILQQRRRLGLADAAIDLGPVQAGGRGEKAHAALDRAALG